jgi:hypothetical protein
MVRYLETLMAALRPRGDPFRSRSMGLCLAGHPPSSPWLKNPSGGPENNLCTSVPAISRPHPSVARGYLIVDSSVND